MNLCAPGLCGLQVLMALIFAVLGLLVSLRCRKLAMSLRLCLEVFYGTIYLVAKMPTRSPVR